MKFVVLAIALVAPVVASPARGVRALSQWSQCGGTGYSGSTVCAQGLACVYQNDWYSQCNVASSSKAAAPTSTIVAKSPSSSPAVIQTSSSTLAPVKTSVATKVSTTSTSSPKAQTSSTSTASGATSTLGSSVAGIATSYGGNWPGGACSLGDYPHVGINGLAAGGQLWGDAAGCGSCLAVTGPNNKTVVAMVMDECPECATNHLDLDTAWASQIAANGGIFDIQYQVVPCQVSGNLQYKNKDGTSQWYFALQVRNSVLPIAKLEVSTNNGASWTAVQRTEYNFFTYTSGFGNVVDLRITASTGAQIIEKGVAVASSTIVQGTQQFKA